MIDGKRLTEKRVVIETANLELIPCELKHFEAILTDRRQLEQMLGVIVLDDWFDFPGVAGIEAVRLCTSVSMPTRTCLVGGRTF